MEYVRRAAGKQKMERKKLDIIIYRSSGRNAPVMEYVRWSGAENKKKKGIEYYNVQK